MIIIDKIYNNDFFGRIFHTLQYCLKQELSECESVLDIGCGPDSPLWFCKNVKYSVGVEPWEPYSKKSQAKKIHDKYLNQKIEDLDFEKNSFDAVILIEVIEHLPKEKVPEVLEKSQKWARKKVIITTPNGFVEQPEADENPLQKHLSGWNVQKMKDLGFSVKGLAGIKYLRKAKPDGEFAEGDLLVTIKFRPRFLWFCFATISQVFTYHFADMAFGLFCVKKLE